MLTTKYYEKNLTIRFKFLEPYQESLGFYKNSISRERKIKITIPDDLIVGINKELLKLNRVKSSIDIFSGSNSSGAETNHKSTNIVTFYGEDDNKSFYNFSNPLNRKEIYKNDKNVEINSIDEIEVIEFSEYLKMSSKANELYCYYNSLEMILNEFGETISNLDGYANINFEDNQFIDKQLELIDKEKTIKEETSSIKDFIDKSVKKSINEYIEIFNNQNKEIENDQQSKKRENKLVSKLRNAQRLLVKEEIRNLIQKYPNYEKSYFLNSLNDSYINYECAHIIPVSESRKSNKTLYEIADNNNCLLLSPNIHNSYDKNNISFDSNGVCYIKGNKEPKLNIKKEWLNEKRKMYLKKSFISRNKNK